MNILVLSVGTRNKIVQYLKKELNNKGKVIVTDMSRLAPALYEADAHYIVPSIFDKEYIKEILEICKKEQIKGIFSLIDPELEIIANHKSLFDELGIMIFGSSSELCRLSFDKWSMYEWLTKNNFLTPLTFQTIDAFKIALSQDKINFPVIVKPQNGSASLNVTKVDDIEYLSYLYRKHSNLIIQEYIDGEEIGVDCYIDMISKQLVSIFLKKKLVMRAGETDKSVSFKNTELFKLVQSLVKKAEFLGPIDIDIFYKDNRFYISEINPRFGGGYPHAYICGVNHMGFMVNNLNGRVNQPEIGNYEEDVYMMKYGDVLSLKEE